MRLRRQAAQGHESVGITLAPSSMERIRRDSVSVEALQTAQQSLFYPTAGDRLAGCGGKCSPASSMPRQVRFPSSTALEDSWEPCLRSAADCVTDNDSDVTASDVPVARADTLVCLTNFQNGIFFASILSSLILFTDNILLSTKRWRHLRSAAGCFLNEM